MIRGTNRKVSSMTNTIISTLLFAVVAISAGTLIILGNRMSLGKLGPNSWCGVRTKTALASTENWYKVQKKCGTTTIMLGASYFDSAILFLIQSMLPKLLSIFVPLLLFAIQSTIGIVLIYMRSSLNTQEENS